MADTELNIQDAITEAGTVTVINGQTKGPRGRTITLQATATTGYVFNGWEVEKKPVTLRPFITQVDGLYASVESACNYTSNNTEQRVAKNTEIKTLYTDGSKLYTDSEGIYQASTGIWALSGRTAYINYDGTILPVTETCTAPQTQPTVSGGGGGFFVGRSSAGIGTVDSRLQADGDDIRTQFDIAVR
jgi:hypothetical protein